MSLLLVGRVAEKAPPKSWCSIFVVVVHNLWNNTYLEWRENTVCHIKKWL